MEWFFQIKIIIHVIIAMILGGIIGLEREMSAKPAGLRTQMLVAGVAALLIKIGDLLVQYFNEDISKEIIRSDPIRMIQAIVLGISFLGAGTIIRHGTSDRVEGLTTAATILISATVGICIGINQYLVACATAIITFLVLYFLRNIEKFIHNRTK
jgi:putative Mg2+ transporter-C (MgtC) family protein